MDFIEIIVIRNVRGENDFFFVVDNAFIEFTVWKNDDRLMGLLFQLLYI